MLKQSYLLGSAALVLAVAACSDSTGVSGTISQADANQLAADMDAVTTLGATDFGQSASFSVSVDGSGASATVVSAPFPINTSSRLRSSAREAGKS